MPKTYNDIYFGARKLLKAQSIEAYSLEALLIVSTAARKTKEQYIRDAQLYASDDFEPKVQELIERRLQGEPVAYITGNWEFYGLTIDVNRDVLIPRIDSEVLAETGIELARKMGNTIRVLDLCAGSGCIGTAIGVNVPACRIVMSDVSAAALRVCRFNALRHKLTSRCTCVEGDALKEPPMLLGSFDMIVCNPPYIPSNDIDGLDVSVRAYEPRLALDGGEDGLEFYRSVTKRWTRLLKSGGALLFECGALQARSVKLIMEGFGFRNIETKKDTLNIDRVVYAIKE